MWIFKCIFFKKMLHYNSDMDKDAMEVKMDLKILDYKNDMEKIATVDLLLKLVEVFVTKGITK